MANSYAEQGMASSLEMLLTFFLSECEDGYNISLFFFSFPLNTSVSII